MLANVFNAILRPNEFIDRHPPILDEQITSHNESAQRLNVQPQAVRGFFFDLDLFPSRLGGCNVGLGLFCLPKSAISWI